MWEMSRDHGVCVNRVCHEHISEKEEFFFTTKIDGQGSVEGAWVMVCRFLQVMVDLRVQRCTLEMSVSPDQEYS